MNNIKTVSALNKLYKQEKQFKRELAQTFLEYLDALPTNKRIEQMEAILYERKLPTLDRRLTAQEKKCLFLASKGKEIKDMASILGLSGRTVKYHRANIIKKLEVANFTAAMVSVVQYNMLNHFGNIDLRLDEIRNFQILPDIKLIAGIHWWKDINGVYQGCNSAMVEALGFSSCDEIIGRTDYELPWVNQANILVKHDKIVLDGIIQKGKEEIVAIKSGEVRTFLVAKAPIRDQTKNIIGTVGNSIDVTDLQMQVYKYKNENQLLKDKINTQENKIRELRKLLK